MVQELDSIVYPYVRSDLDFGSDPSMSIFEERESSVRYYCRSFPTTFASAKGALLFDTEGRSYIDFLSAAGSLNYGHNHPAIKAELLAYLESDGLTTGLDLHTVAKRAFLEEFTELILKPRALDYLVQFTGPTGTNAVEAALKIARKATGVSGIFAFMGGYHGDSLGSLAATANRGHRAGAGVSLGDVTFLPYPVPNGPLSQIDSLAYLRNLLVDTHSGVEVPAAILVETVQAEGGVYLAPVEWLRGLRAICDEFGMILIIDEIQTGCGRTGPFFSFERADIVPDVVTVSKSISGYGLPMSLVLLRPELDLWEPGEHTGTFRGNQLAFVAGRRALQLFYEEDLESSVAEAAELIRKRLEADVLHLDRRITLRGIGMIWGIDLAEIDPTGALATAVARRCFAEGLVIERVGRNSTVVKLLPPLNIDPSELEQGLTILVDSLKSSLT